MPRTTRAALRAQDNGEFQILNDDGEPVLMDVDFVPNEGEREALAEVAGNVSTNSEATMTGDEPVSDAAPLQKALKPRGRKVKGGKKSMKKAGKHEVEIEVLEDESQSSGESSAVEEACKELRKQGPPPFGYQIPMNDFSRPMTPVSPAARAASRSVSPRKKESLPNSEVKNPGMEHSTKIASSPSKNMASFADLEDASALQQEEQKDDSFVADITSRSPTKPCLRIEDSVEALDALDDAIEQVGKALPEMDEPHSPIKTRTSSQSPALKSSTKKMAIKDATAVQSKKPNTRTRALAQQAKPKSSEQLRRNASISSKGTATRDLKGEQANSPKISPPRQSFSGLAKKPSTKRPVSITAKPFQPAKSAKVPTVSTFELPGEKIARELKAKREERKKREEEEQKKPAFKARPIMQSKAATVKMNNATKARLSLAGNPKQVENTQVDGPSIRPLPRPSTSGPGLKVAKRPTPAVANISALRSSTAPRVSSINASRAGTAVGMKPNKEETVQQKTRAREIFGRDKKEEVEKEKTRKEKEEAARKARQEASERGRQASRDWAAKQLAKKAAEKKAS